MEASVVESSVITNSSKHDEDPSSNAELTKTHPRSLMPPLLAKYEGQIEVRALFFAKFNTTISSLSPLNQFFIHEINFLMK